MSRWLFPIGIVLLVSLALAAVHFYFTRFLARLSESAPEEPPDSWGNACGSDRVDEIADMSRTESP